MHRYPLYEKLLEEIKKKEDVPINVMNCCEAINNIALLDHPEEHYQEIQALIMHHDALHHDNILLSKTPNDGYVLPSGKDVMYQFNKCPGVLKKIIIEYLLFYSS